MTPATGHAGGSKSSTATATSTASTCPTTASHRSRSSQVRTICGSSSEVGGRNWEVGSEVNPPSLPTSYFQLPTTTY